MSLVHQACRERKSLSEVRALVEQDDAYAVLTERDHEGMLPLHRACLSGCSLEVVHYLVDQVESTLKEVSDCSDTVLHLACLSWTGPQTEVLRYLIEKDPTALKARDDDYGIPLHSLAQNHYTTSDEESKDALRLLIQKYPEGAKATDLDGYTPLRILCANDFMHSINIKLGPKFRDLPHYERERKRECQERWLYELRQDMIAILVEAYPQAMHIKDKEKGNTPMTLMERKHQPTFDMMKTMETPEMTQVQRLQKEIQELRAENKRLDKAMQEMA